jgi:exosome complex exonuclease RRP6
VQYPAFMFQRNSPLPPKSFEETPFTWVATTNDLEDMLAVLRGASEIAVDLEHHDYRTYGGFVCLMQVSTRQQDWIVDTLALREELEDLNEVFTNHNIVKVKHTTFTVSGISRSYTCYQGISWCRVRHRLVAA